MGCLGCGRAKEGWEEEARTELNTGIAPVVGREASEDELEDRKKWLKFPLMTKSEFGIKLLFSEQT